MWTTGFKTPNWRERGGHKSLGTLDGASRALLAPARRSKHRLQWRLTQDSGHTSETITDELLAFERAHYAPDRYAHYAPPSQVAKVPEQPLEETRPGLDSYVQLQRVLLRGTLFAGTFGSLVTFWLGSKEDGFSFMLGASVSVVYVLLLGHGVNRMLENQTDAANSKTNSSTGAVLERARHVTSGPLRILLFIALVLGVAKQRESLHVLPAFLGFLSYKVAVLGQMLGALRASNQDG